MHVNLTAKNFGFKKEQILGPRESIEGCHPDPRYICCLNIFTQYFVRKRPSSPEILTTDSSLKYLESGLSFPLMHYYNFLLTYFLNQYYTKKKKNYYSSVCVSWVGENSLQNGLTSVTYISLNYFFCFNYIFFSFK